MSIQDGIPEKGSLLDDINEFGRLVNDLAVSMGKEPTCKPITLKPITTKVTKMRNLLAEIDIPMAYGGSDDWWITVRVYGEIVTGTETSTTQRWIETPRFEIGEDDAENFLPEKLKDAICDDILRGQYD